MIEENGSKLPDLNLQELNINPDDKAANKFLMLIEGTYGIGVAKSTKKYGYSVQRYYQIKKNFLEKGSESLIDLKRGPQGNHVRTEEVGQLIIQMRQLEPSSSAAVIAEKLNQQGIKISLRSVERAITQYGLQKRTHKSREDFFEENSGKD